MPPFHVTSLTEMIRFRLKASLSSQENVAGLSLFWFGAFQIRYHGDVNIANYSRHLSAAHGHTLASADLYVYVMFVAF